MGNSWSFPIIKIVIRIKNGWSLLTIIITRIIIQWYDERNFCQSLSKAIIDGIRKYEKWSFSITGIRWGVITLRHESYRRIRRRRRLVRTWRPRRCWLGWWASRIIFASIRIWWIINRRWGFLIRWKWWILRFR